MGRFGTGHVKREARWSLRDRVKGRAQEHAWVVAIFAALFLLQAPLCAVACLSGSAQGTDALQLADARSEPATSGHACHDEGAPSRPSDAPSSSHEDCGCEMTVNAVVSQPSGVPTPPPPVAMSISPEIERNETRARCDACIVEATDLPPPDILLLKSTLIL